MPKFLSAKELFHRGRAELLLQNGDIPVEVVDRPGSDANLLLASSAAMGETVSLQLVYVFRSLFVAYAVGAELDLLVWDLFQLTRRPAAASSGYLRFARSSFTTGAVTYPVGFQVQSDTGVVVELTQEASFGATQIGYVYATARAQQVGYATNVKADTLTTFLTANLDSNVTVTNPQVFAGGSEVESDADLRARAYLFFSTLRRGTRPAIEWGAKTVAGVQSAVATVPLDTSLLPFGVVDLAVADAAGYGNAALTQLVEDALDEYAAAGIYVRVLSGVAYEVEIEVDPDYQTGVDTVAKRESVRAAIVAYVNSGLAGQTLYVAKLYAAMTSVSGVLAPLGSVLVPAGDVVPTTDQVIRTLSAKVKVNGV